MNKKTIIALIAFVTVVAVAVGIWWFFLRPEGQEGSKTVTIVVVHSNGTEKTVTAHTDAEFLEEVLLAEGIVKAEDNESGMYNIIDGEKADWNVDEGWWQVFEGDTASVRGVAEIPVIDGSVYKFVYTVGFDGF